MLAGAQINRVQRLQHHDAGLRPTHIRTSVDHQKVDMIKTFYRLAQRPGRQTTAIADTAIRIEHHDLCRTRQGKMLQPVITDDNVRTVLADGVIKRPTPTRINHHRNAGAATNQQGSSPACSAD